MGYSISQEQYEKSERLRLEGRQCAMSTGRGGCFNRATYRITQDSWPYTIGEGKPHRHVMTLCGRHAKDQEPGYEGVNFRVVSKERY